MACSSNSTDNTFRRGSNGYLIIIILYILLAIIIGGNFNYY